MMKLDLLENHISHYLEKIDLNIRFILEKSPVLEIAAAAAFGGKRIRPIILILLSCMLGERHTEKFLLAAISIELIHIASLLHDDVIDSSSLRHNKETAHTIFGNQQTILAGDFIFAASFEKMIETKSFEALRIISRASSKLARGELEQLKIKKGVPIALSNYLDIIYKKTASLFEAAAEIAGVIQEKKLPCLKVFGKNIGMAFQIIDDLIDYTSLEAGKKRGIDFNEGKSTLPLIFALSDDSALSFSEKEELKFLFGKPKRNIDDFSQALNLIQKSNALEFCKKKAVEFCETASNSLFACGKNTIEFTIINEIIAFFVKRTF